MDEKDLGRRFAAGDDGAWEQAVDRYGRRLLRYATAIVCDVQTAEDVVQEVFLSAYRKQRSFDGENLSAWLYKMTYHRSINERRRRSIISFSPLHEGLTVPEGDDGLSEQTLAALARLKPKERALIYGRIMEGQSYEELSALLGASPAALRKQYQRVKERLAAYINESRQGKESLYERI